MREGCAAVVSDRDIRAMSEWCRAGTMPTSGTGKWTGETVSAGRFSPAAWLVGPQLTPR
jgi:hypothetical protein